MGGDGKFKNFSKLEGEECEGIEVDGIKLKIW